MLSAVESGEVDTAFEIISEFGVVHGLLVFLVIALCFSIKWLASKVLLPVSKAAIENLNGQTLAIVKIVESMENLAALEKEIRSAMLEMRDSHQDNNSTFATVHTNAAIGVLGKAIGKIAVKMDVDVDDLIQELQTTLGRQKV